MKRHFKKLAATSLAFTAALALTFPSYAAGWVQSPQGWWWSDEVNGSPVSCWRWLDGNGDGWAECYYFDHYGYMAENTTTPDGYQVDASGAWVVDGVVQTVYQDPAAQDQEEEPEEVWVDTTEENPSYRFFETDHYSQGTNKTLNLSDGSTKFWSSYLCLTGYDGFIKMDVKTRNKFRPETLVANVYSTNGTLTIYGDNDEELESFEFDYEDSIREIAVDVSDQSSITIKTSSGPHYMYFQYLKLEGQERYQ